LVSDIPANKAVELNESDYFPVGNVDELSSALENKIRTCERFDYSKYMVKYDWNLIAKQTLDIYESVYN
jgi:starch synthase